jgi:hypothetical protein
MARKVPPFSQSFGDYRQPAPAILVVSAHAIKQIDASDIIGQICAFAFKDYWTSNYYKEAPCRAEARQC